MALMDMDYRLKWQIGQEFSIDVFDLSLWQLTTNVLCYHLDSMYAWYQFVDEGLGGSLRWWSPSTMWVGPLISLWTPQGMSEWSHLFEFGLYAVCWVHFVCRHKLWPTWVSHPFSFLNISLGFAIPGYFPYILFYHYLFSLLSSYWFVIAVCGSFSVRELVKYLESL